MRPEHLSGVDKIGGVEGDSCFELLPGDDFLGEDAKGRGEVETGAFLSCPVEVMSVIVTPADRTRRFADGDECRFTLCSGDSLVDNARGDGVLLFGESPTPCRDRAWRLR